MNLSHRLLTLCAREVANTLRSDIEWLADGALHGVPPVPHSVKDDALGTRARFALAQALDAAGYPVTPDKAPAWWPMVMDGSLPLFPEEPGPALADTRAPDQPTPY